MTKSKAAAAPKATAAAPSKPSRPARPAKPPCAHLWLDQVEGDGPERVAFRRCQHCRQRVNLTWSP